MTTYDPAREVTEEFIDRVADWLVQRGEVLVVLRYLHAAGAKDFALCRSRAEFERIIELVPRGTDIEAFRELQLPLRGVVTDHFIVDACNALRDADEYLLVTLARRPGSAISADFGMGETVAELCAELEEQRGMEVALGALPNFNVEDHEGLISRSKGGIDGSR